MIEAATPTDEEARLTALRRLGLLDAPPSERFDRITRTGRRALGVPIALVTLVDANRQWFASCFGLDIRQTPRSVSFCAHAILRDGPLVIPDAGGDERFADNPLVTGPPHIRFYAGIPLHSTDGHAVGTFCAIDLAPRDAEAIDLTIMQDLAAWAEHELNADELSRALRDRQLSERRLAVVVDAVADGIATFDPRGRVLSLNPSAERMFGTSSAEAVGREAASLLVGGHGDIDDLGAVLASPASGQPPVHEVIGRRADGTTFPMELKISPAEGPDGRIWVVALTDITERRAVERLKDEFVSIVSHELRTPLTSIRGSLGLLAGGVLGQIPGEARHMLGIALASTERLIRLVNDILDLERIRSGHSPARPEDVQLRELLEEAVVGLQPVADAAGIVLDVRSSAALVVLDRDRVVQAVTNLVGNALKFSPPSTTVTVIGDLTAAAGGRGGEVLISVQDQGRGIPAEAMDRLFEPFQQLDSTDAREHGGTGLGLAIVRTIAEAHGGRVEVESKVGVGSAFTLRLPQPRPGAGGAERGEIEGGA